MKITLLIISLLCFINSFAQLDLPVKGCIKDEANEKLGNVKISVIDFGDTIQQTYSAKNGKYGDIKLPFGSRYIILMQKTGFIEKRIMVDLMKNYYKEDINSVSTIDLSLTLDKKNVNKDYSKIECSGFMYGKFQINPNSGSIMVDYKYSKDRREIYNHIFETAEEIQLKKDKPEVNKIKVEKKSYCNYVEFGSTLSFRGYVTDANSVKLKDALVSFSCADSILRSEKTLSNGKYPEMSFSMGNIILMTISKKGYMSKRILINGKDNFSLEDSPSTNPIEMPIILNKTREGINYEEIENENFFLGKMSIDSSTGGITVDWSYTKQKMEIYKNYFPD